MTDNNNGLTYYIRRRRVSYKCEMRKNKVNMLCLGLLFRVFDALINSQVYDALTRISVLTNKA